MKRNQHIGLLAFKWQLYAIPVFVILYYIVGFVIDMVLGLLPDPIYDHFLPAHTVHHEDIEYIINLHESNGLFSIILVLTGIKLLNALEHVVEGFRLLGRKAASAIFSDGGIVSIGLYIYATGLGLYKMGYLNLMDVGEMHSTAKEQYTLIVWGLACLQVYLQAVVPFNLVEYVADGYKIRLRIKQDKNYHKLFDEGFGGSARWANVIELAKRESRFRRPDGRTYHLEEIFLGRSLFHDDPTPRLISVKDDVHMVTIGMTGSGKSTTVLMPNLVYYGGSVYVFDPKGELAKNTLRRRTSERNIEREESRVKVSKGNTSEHFVHGMGYALDPYNETRGQFGECRYNPLSDIDLEDDMAAAMLSAISDGCVLQQHEKDSHWSDWAKSLIEALIVHTLSRYPEQYHNLPFILDIFSGKAYPGYKPEKDHLDIFKELLIDMQTNDSFGGLAQQVAAKIMDMGDDEKGAVLSTTYRSLKWIGDPKMRTQLSETIIFKEEKPNTTYIILPQENISNQIRWVRVLMGMFINREKKLYKQSSSRISSLFIFDEFYQLGGNLDAISKGFPMLRGFNIKLWLIVQDISQLKQVFGTTWQDIVSGSTVQAFGINDTETAEWISKRLGSRQNFEETEGNEEKGIPDRKYKRVEPLLSPDEVETMLRKGNDEQIVFPTDGRPMRLQSLTYKPISGYNELPYPYKLKNRLEDYSD